MRYQLTAAPCVDFTAVPVASHYRHGQAQTALGQVNPNTDSVTIHDGINGINFCNDWKERTRSETKNMGVLEAAFADALELADLAAEGVENAIKGDRTIFTRYFGNPPAMAMENYRDIYKSIRAGETRPGRGSNLLKKIWISKNEPAISTIDECAKPKKRILASMTQFADDPNEYAYVYCYPAFYTETMLWEQDLRKAYGNADLTAVVWWTTGATMLHEIMHYRGWIRGYKELETSRCLIDVEVGEHKCYGAVATQNLAASSPAMALQNCDNWTCFAAEYRHSKLHKVTLPSLVNRRECYVRP